MQRTTGQLRPVERPVLSTIAFEDSPRGHAMQGIFDATRVSQARFWTYVKERTEGDPRALQRFAQAMAKKEWAIGGAEAQYFPHILAYPFRQRLDLLREMALEGAGSSVELRAEAAARTLASATGVASARMAARSQGLGMIPHLETLTKLNPHLIDSETKALLEDYLNRRAVLMKRRLRSYVHQHETLGAWKEELAEAMRGLGYSPNGALTQANQIEQLVKMGHKEQALVLVDNLVGRLGGVPQYSLDYRTVMPSYVHSVAP